MAVLPLGVERHRITASAQVGRLALLRALRGLEHFADGAQTGFQRALHPGVRE
jgi:hypothetical protein